MTFMQFLTASGLWAWIFAFWLAFRYVRRSVERARDFKRRLSWAIWGSQRALTRR